MKRTIFPIAVLAFLFVSCNSGSEEYQKADNILSELKSSIKKAKTCSDLEDAASGILGISFVIDINQCSEEEKNILERRVQEIFEYAQETRKRRIPLQIVRKKVPMKKISKHNLLTH